MPERADQIHWTLTRAERKRLLGFACAADRMAWLETSRPEPARSRGAQLAADVLHQLESISAFLPGRFGRWVRGMSFLTQLGRQFGWLRL